MPHAAVPCLFRHNGRKEWVYNTCMNERQEGKMGVRQAYCPTRHTQSSTRNSPNKPQSSQNKPSMSRYVAAVLSCRPMSRPKWYALCHAKTRAERRYATKNEKHANAKSHVVNVCFHAAINQTRRTQWRTQNNHTTTTTTHRLPIMSKTCLW